MRLNPLCPCDSQLNYSDCCEVYHKGTTIAPTAEALMRSRYSAYCKTEVDYLIKTQHATTRKTDDRTVILEGFRNTEWVGLTILKTQKGMESDRRGIVEFVALHRSRPNPLQLTSKETSTLYQLHERSRFIREQDQWFYIDGDILPPVKLKPKK